RRPAHRPPGRRRVPRHLPPGSGGRRRGSAPARRGANRGGGEPVSRRRDETGARAEVRQAAAELRRISRVLLKLGGTDDPTPATDGYHLLREVAHDMGLQAGWLAEELTLALDGQRRGETPPLAPFRRIVLTVPREQAVPWTICSGRAGRPVGEWLAGLADAEIERLSELADR